MLSLLLSAELDNVNECGFIDSPDKPFFFTFKVECANCHEIHPNDIAFNAYETRPLTGSRGEANFVMKCKFCGKEGNVNMEPKLTSYTTGVKGPVKMATFDNRGLVLKEFVPRGQFWAKSEDSGSQFTLEFDDNEWYDYDEKAGTEVSITDAKWTIAKSK